MSLPRIRSPHSSKSWLSNYMMLTFMMNGQLFPEYHRIVRKLGLTKVSSANTTVKHNITHHIDTTVSARPRILAADRLKEAKQEFEHMMQLGIIRPSWSSPLHMVPKKTPGD